MPRDQLSRQPGRHRQSGFTLLELLVAVTLMAVVALLGWRGLDALIGARDSLSRAGDDLRAITVAFSQIEEDLRRAWPVRLIDTGRPYVTVAGESGSSGTVSGAARLDLLREAPAVAALAPGAMGAEGESISASALASGLQRVVWRLEGGRLERGFIAWWSPAIDPKTSGALRGAEEAALTTLVWQPVVEGVESVAWRVFIAGQGWVVAPQSPSPPEAQVVGVEFVIVKAGERIVRMFSVRD